MSFQDNIEKCVPVIGNMQHGQIFPTQMFGENSTYKWAFIGCAHTGDSKVAFGRAPEPTGPFECFALMDANPLMPLPGANFTYCMYPHPWAFKDAVDDLMITWSEGTLQGNVVAARIRLQTEWLSHNTLVKDNSHVIVEQ